MPHIKPVTCAPFLFKHTAQLKKEFTKQTLLTIFILHLSKISCSFHFCRKTKKKKPHITLYIIFAASLRIEGVHFSFVV